MDTNQAIAEMGRIAVQFGGFLVSSNTYQRINSYSYAPDPADSMPYGEAVIRVKAENFDQAIALIEQLTPDTKKYVTSKVISGEDITSDFVDTSARLTSLEKLLLNYMRSWIQRPKLKTSSRFTTRLRKKNLRSKS